jgi:hypothetical protein
VHGMAAVLEVMAHLELLVAQASIGFDDSGAARRYLAS